MKYQHIFFDLDRTLWDFEKSSRQTLSELFHHFDLNERGLSTEQEFITTYLVINEHLWELYRNNAISKDQLRSQRFLDTLAQFTIRDEELAEAMGTFYINECPLKENLFPHTYEMLEALSKKASLHIITNGFEEVQHLKLKTCGLDHYFGCVITSEQAGVKKPEPAIFEMALAKTGAFPESSLMVGDDVPVDLQGAAAMGLDTAYFNPRKRPRPERVTYEYSDHAELPRLIG